MRFARYAIFYIPPADADWVRSCTGWLGWDVNTGRAVAHPEIADLPLPVSELTQAPRRYGLHATLKPPFRLASDQTEDSLKAACAALARDQAPVQLSALTVTRLGRFLALCPVEPPAALSTLAARCVSELDPFRAEASAAELDRRRDRGLSVRQDHNLTRWGYPHVMDLFRFHITLTGRMPKTALARVETALNEILAGQIPTPLHLTDLALLGEDDAGLFHLIQRYPFMG